MLETNKYNTSLAEEISEIVGKLQKTDLPDLTNNAIIITDPDNSLLFLNKQAESLYKCNRLEHINKPLSSLFTIRWILPEDEERLDSSLREKGFFSGEITQKLPNGNEIFADTKITALKNQKQQIIGYHYAVYDITDYKLAKRHALITEKRFSLISEIAPLGIIMMKGNRQIIYCNDFMTTLTGYSREELISMDIFGLTHEDYRDYILEMNKLRMQGKDVPDRFELKIVRKDKKVRWVYVSVAVTVFENQSTVVGSITDITQRKNHEEEIAKSENRYRELLDSMDDGVVVIDYNWRLILLNKAIGKMGNFDSDAVLGLKMLDVFTEVKNSPLLEKLKEVMEERISNELIEQYTSDKGEQYYYEVRIYPVSEGILVLLRDISAARKAEKALKQSENLLRESNELKSKLFSIIAHDLKNPFMGFLGITELIADPTNEFTMEEMREYSTKMHNSAKNIFNLLQNLLHWSHLQTGRIKLFRTTFDLNSLIQTIKGVFSFQAEIKHISILTPNDEELIVFADKDMTNTIIRNLVSNALKFTPQGGSVTIRTALEQGNVVISVIDTGIGMNEEMVQKLFSLGETPVREGTQKEKGTGLGLILCQEFIKHSGGEFRIESEPGKGTTFTFTIPILEKT